MGKDRKEQWAQLFKNPPAKHRMKAILHAWPGDEEALIDALQAFGYGGTATNPSFKNGYTSNPDNIRKFDTLTKSLSDRGLTYWVYDENGYPSGYAGGKTLEGHPEFEAKGFYMIRRIAYEPKTVRFLLDDASDRIVWAAKYPLDCSVLNASVVCYDKMEPVPFTEKSCTCDLHAEEVLFIFCVKSAYEGTHCVHNVCSHSRYINILEDKAVERYLEVNYEPIAKDAPNAYPEAEAVFTDEPSLMAGYIHGEETWDHALAPWFENLFDAFQEEYGFSLLPYLPMIFEGRDSSYSIRIKFYELIAKQAATSYVRQIKEWCHTHGTNFSGHYLAEESLLAHVVYYGNYKKVLEETDLPGADILASHPGVYNWNTPKFAQMAARKNGKPGIMVELCPFMDLETFRRNPVEYARGILNLMILNGCRSINSYFTTDFASYDSRLKDYQGDMKKEEACSLNAYVGRLLSILNGIDSESGVFIYYAIEEAQAKLRPSHTAIEASSSAVDRSIKEITNLLIDAGRDYLFCDREDLKDAAANAGKGIPTISGIPVQMILIPAMDVIYEESMKALKTLQKSGVRICFVDQIPRLRAEVIAPFAYYDFREESNFSTKLKTDGVFTAMDGEEVSIALKELPNEFLVSADDEKGGLLSARFSKDGIPFYMILNNRQESRHIRLKWSETEKFEIWDPENGSISVYSAEDSLAIGAYRILLIFKS